MGMRNPFAMPPQHYPMANTFGLGRYGRPTPYGYGAEMAIHHDGLHNGAGYGAAAQAQAQAQYMPAAQAAQYALPAQPAQELVGLGQPQMKQQLVMKQQPQMELSDPIQPTQAPH